MKGHFLNRKPLGFHIYVTSHQGKQQTCGCKVMINEKLTVIASPQTWGIEPIAPTPTTGMYVV